MTGVCPSMGMRELTLMTTLLPCFVEDDVFISQPSFNLYLLMGPRISPFSVALTIPQTGRFFQRHVIELTVTETGLAQVIPQFCLCVPPPRPPWSSPRMVDGMVTR